MGKQGKIKDKTKPYGTRKTHYTQLVYIVGTLIWLVIIFLLRLYPPNWFGWLLLLFPIIIFYIGFSNAEELTIEMEEEMFKVNHLALGLIIVLSLFTWISRDYSGDQRSFVALLLFAIIFSLLSIVDVWVSRKWFSLIKHFKSVLQTLAIFMLIYALYLYYWYRQGQALP